MKPVFAIFLAQSGDVYLGGGMTPAMREWLIVMAVLFAVSVVIGGLFVWRATHHKRRRHHHHHHHHSSPTPLEESGSSEKRRRRRHRRSRHPDNLPRNPTLAETGGLPPVRGEEGSEGAAEPPR